MRKLINFFFNIKKILFGPKKSFLVFDKRNLFMLKNILTIKISMSYLQEEKI